MTSETAAAILVLVAYVAGLAVKIVALGVIPANRRPTSAAAWLLLIFFYPFFGLILFNLLGSTYVDKKRREEQQAIDRLIAEGMHDAPALPAVAGHELVFSAVDLNRHLGALPAFEGNCAHLIPDYDDSIAAMAAEVAKARSYVHVTFYIMSWDDVTEPMFAALADAVRRGVEVRLLFDHIGTSRIKGYGTLRHKMTEAGIDWHWMLPIRPFHGQWRRPDLRNHRKIVVVDGEVAFVGSQNLIHPSYHNPKHEKAGRRWHELMARVEGPIVESLDIVFATDWFIETREDLRGMIHRPEPVEGEDTLACQVIPSGPGFPNENNLRVFNTLIYGARNRLSITSPYFVPDESLLYAVTTAAQRGVQVELFVGEQGDQFMVHHAQRSYYQALLDAGVRIYLYPAPAVLHAKHFTVDDHVAVIGSSNMDIRSFNLDFEVSLLCFGTEFVKEMRAVEDRYRALSTELLPEAWSTRSRGQRYLDNVMRLTSALQ